MTSVVDMQTCKNDASFFNLFEAVATRATPRRGSASRGESAGTSTVIAQFLLQTHNKKIFDVVNEGQGDGTHRSQ